MGLLKTAAKVAVASSVHGRVQRRQQERWAGQDASGSHGDGPAVTAPVAVPAPTEDPTVTQLRQLAGLRDAGILTEEEFAAKKVKVLGI